MSILLPFVYLPSVVKTFSFPGIIATRQEINREAPLPVQPDAEQEFQRLQERRKTTFAVSLAAVSGVLDVVCVRKFGCFAHLMTGNTVKCLTAATELKWKEASFYAAMVASYVLGAAGYRLVDTLHTKRQQDRKGVAATKNVSTIYHLSFILLPVFAISDVLVRLLHWPASTVAMLWAFGGGVVNASTMNVLGIVTNAVTGHWNRLGISLIDYLASGKQKDAVKTTYKVLTATALCVCGTTSLTKFVAKRYGFAPPMGLVIGMLYFALFRWYGENPSQS
eukprot:scaffold43532_cov191-Amphora_coffeaeformis.AAC.4